MTTQQRLEQLEAELKDIKATLKKEESEWPQQGEKYWSVDYFNSVEYHYADILARNYSQVFRTIEAAQMEALRRQCRASRPKVNFDERYYYFDVNEEVIASTIYAKSPRFNFDLFALTSGLYGRTEDEAKERYEKYGKAFEYLLKGDE